MENVGSPSILCQRGACYTYSSKACFYVVFIEQVARCNNRGIRSTMKHGYRAHSVTTAAVREKPTGSSYRSINDFILILI